MSLPFTLGSGLRLFRKHIAETTAQIQWVQRLLGEVVKAVIRELRKKQKLVQTLECLKVHDLLVKSSSLVSGEQGPKQRQSTSGSPKWHIFGLQEASHCPMHSCHGNHSAATPKGMQRGEGRCQRHMVTFLENAICSFPSRKHLGGGEGVGIGV